MAAGFEIFYLKTDGYHFRLRNDKGTVVMSGAYSTKDEALSTVQWIKANAGSLPISYKTGAASKSAARSLSRS